MNLSQNCRKEKKKTKARQREKVKTRKLVISDEEGSDRVHEDGGDAAASACLAGPSVNR